MDSIPNAPERFFLETLFTRLNDDGIIYAVMRNYESLPYSSGGSDLDILVAPHDAIRMEEILSQVIIKEGGVSIGKSRTVGFYKENIFGRNTSRTALWWGQRIDVNIGLIFKGCPLLDDRKWPNFIIQHNNIYVLSGGIAGVLGILKEVLNNARLSSRYLPAAKAALEHEWEQIAEALKPMGDKALKLFHRLISSSLEDDVSSLCRQLFNALMAHAKKRHPIRSLQLRYLCWWSKLSRYFFPAGSMIAFLGVDGAGKSTVIKAINPVLEAATHNAVLIRHLRPGLLPPLARLKGKIQQPPSPVLDPHSSTPSGIFGSLFRLGYLTFDYILGYWLLIRPQIAKQPAIVLFDRYAYDMALDPRRFRIGLPGWVAGLFARCAPRPDLIICLYADPEIIISRKQELPIEEICRQVKTLQTFVYSTPNAIMISTDGNIDAIRERVMNAFFQFFSKRKKIVRHSD